jgi:hypothetical protein
MRGTVGLPIDQGSHTSRCADSPCTASSSQTIIRCQPGWSQLAGVLSRQGIRRVVAVGMLMDPIGSALLTKLNLKIIGDAWGGGPAEAAWDRLQSCLQSRQPTS